MPTETGWLRTVEARQDWTTGFVKIGETTNVTTLLRTRFSWGFVGVTPLVHALNLIQQNIQVMGICTTVGEGGGPPPNPRLQPFDVDPPSQRWLHWEGRAPIATAIDGTSELAMWRDSGAQYAMDIKSMVSAASVPDGEFMSIWASWASAFDWPADGQVTVWVDASMLFQVRL